MTRRGEPFPLTGPAGRLEAELDGVAANPSFRAVVSHPHPLYGGTMDNGVVMLLARALVAAGGEALRFNFRGVGRSEGEHDEGRGERLDLLAAIEALDARRPRLPLVLGGYSFGAVMTLDHLAAVRADGAGGSSAVTLAAVLLIAPPVTHYEGRAWRLAEIPTVVVYGERDGLTPPALIEERAAGWGENVRCLSIPGVGHDLGSFSAPRGLESALETAVTSLVEAATLRA